MKHFFNYRMPAAAAIALLAVSGPAAADLINNGDFANTGSVWVNNTGLGSDDIQSNGGTAPPGWTVVNNNEFWFTSPNSYSGLTASPGNGSAFAIDLTGQANNTPYGGLQQTITTTPGGNYVLTFALGASTNYNNSSTGKAALDAIIGGSSQLFTLAPTSNNTWMTETVDFTAAGSSTTIEFLGDPAFSSEYTGLDNVSVNAVTAAVPETSTWGMMLLGFAGIGVMAYRRKSSKPEFMAA